MIPLVLIAILVLAAGGCVCVVWAERGGPRWVRVVAAMTLGAGKLVRSSGKGSRTKSGYNSGSDGSGGSDG
ncbi:hypothetical protein ACH4SP_33710 [Streptomyces sp. NPDC021093]|uniref:hypothetical protein n=1 Tax=Streptomyces sp. NPDC021093 TaxID=3365112 RepID=UPI0037A2A013